MWRIIIDTCDLTMDLLTCQYGHGRGFAGTIVTKKSRYLTFVHVQTDVFHYNFLTHSRTEFLHKWKQANDTAMTTLSVLLVRRRHAIDIHLWLYNIMYGCQVIQSLEQVEEENKCSAVAEMGDRLDTIDMDWTLGAVPLLGGARSHLTQCRLSRGLPPYQVGSWSIYLFGHNRHGPKIGGCAPFYCGGELRPHLTQSRLGQGLPPYQVAS